MRLSLKTAATLLAGLALVGAAQAQTDVVFQPASGDYFVDDNWLDPFENMFVPSAGFNERAVIDDGRLAFVQTDGGTSPGQVALGTTIADTGTLEVRSGGVLAVATADLWNGGISVGPSGVGVVTVLPGGTLTAQGPLTTGVNAANTITVGAASGAGTATLTPNAAVLNGTTQVYPNADFSTTTTLNFGAGSNYQVEVSGASSGMISAGETATLGGTLTMNFDAAPSIGSSWTVLEANAFSGAFSNLESSSPLPFGQKLILSTADVASRVQANVSLEEVLVMEVNRDTGVATITQPGGSTLSMDSYFLASDGVGALRSSGWSSLNGRPGFGSDWIPVAADANTVGELKASGEVTFASGASTSLGSVYNPFAGGFGESAEDLQFTYSRASDGAIINGVVSYTGTAVNTLLLQVDPVTGEAYLRNTSGSAVQIDGYHVQSDSQSLSSAGWSSLDDQEVEGSGSWLELLSVDSSLVGEFAINAGGTEIAPGDAMNLGNVYVGDGSGSRDLEFEFLLLGQEQGVSGAVIYEAFAGAALFGDFNDDGLVNGADYTIWRDNLGQSDSVLNGNGSNDASGNVVQADYFLWRNHYGISNASAGSAAAAAAPEPTAMLLGLIAAAPLVSRRRKAA
ncbi:hypothetical protein Pla123a_45880 [Posidoniimonas polymericola]|uniref:Dockerin domain-containing protein n=1 Tax=Posidoniimonas polymericola TaxID=2528002 RepID=A0A5C5XUH0_9BACT|nr:hypothetical protein [Posidoniimonas polymericola]TWT66887.1 hypothetical protein Pla123a_45880 [Posidoniimonas polymericola]